MAIGAWAVPGTHLGLLDSLKGEHAGIAIVSNGDTREVHLQLYALTLLPLFLQDLLLLSGRRNNKRPRNEAALAAGHPMPQLTPYLSEDGEHSRSHSTVRESKLQGKESPCQLGEAEDPKNPRPNPKNSRPNPLCTERQTLTPLPRALMLLQ